MAGEPLIPGQEPVLAEGVRGTAFDLPEGIYIPLVIAIEPGSGAVARFLDSLPRDQRVVFPNVISSALAGMLVRRDFRPDVEDGHPILVRPGPRPMGTDCPHETGTVEWALWCEEHGWGRTLALTALAHEVRRLRAQHAASTPSESER